MTVTINGKPCTFEKGEYLLAVARRNGIVIPTLCHHEALTGLGACRVCIVEVEERGKKRIVTACVFPLERECSVETDSPKVQEQRGIILALLRCRAPQSPEIAAFCKQYNAPELPRLRPLDTGACVLCGLCVKACAELGSGAINTMLRGTQKEVATPYNEPSDDCIGCTSCASVCPTSHIAFTQTDDALTIWGRTFPLMHCEACGAVLGTAEALAHAAKAAGQDVPTLCPACRRTRMTDELAQSYGRIIE